MSDTEKIESITSMEVKRKKNKQSNDKSATATALISIDDAANMIKGEEKGETNIGMINANKLGFPGCVTKYISGQLFKYALIALLSFLSSACVKTVIKSSELANKITRLHRDTNQVKLDLDLEERLKKSIEDGKKEFLQNNNLKDFGYYDIKVIEGRVMLTGIVFDAQTKTYIVEKIVNDSATRTLLNELEIRKKVRTTSMSMEDYVLEQNISSKLFLKSKIKSLNYEISVIDGVAYVLGIAEDGSERQLLLDMISTVKGVKQVVSHVITLKSPEKLKIEYK